MQVQLVIAEKMFHHHAPHFAGHEKFMHVRIIQREHFFEHTRFNSIHKQRVRRNGRAKNAIAQIEYAVVSRFIRMRVKTEIFRQLQQEYEMEIRNAFLLQVENLQGARQKRKQLRVALFLFHRFIKYFSDKKRKTRFDDIVGQLQIRVVAGNFFYRMQLEFFAVRYDQINLRERLQYAAADFYRFRARQAKDVGMQTEILRVNFRNHA